MLCGLEGLPINLFVISLKKKEFLPFATSRMELRTIMLSAISQSVKGIPYDLTDKWNLMNEMN